MAEHPDRKVRLSPEATRAISTFQQNLARSVDTSAFNAYVQNLARVQEQYTRALMSPAFEALQEMSRRVAAIAVPDFTAPIRQALADFDKSIRPMLAQFAETAERLRPMLESLGRYPDAMAMFGWPPLEDLGMHDVYWVVTQYDAGAVESAAEVDRRVIAAHPPDRIKQMLGEWECSTLLAREVPILKEAVQAHLERRYALSVPALLLCVEAVAVTLVKPKRGYLGQKQREALVAVTFRGDAKTGDLERATLRASASLFNQMLYGRWLHGEPIPPYLNRHAVLHGGDLEYGDEANSLRAILLLDLLQQQYECFSLVNSRVFHRTGCPQVRRLTSPTKHYLTSRDAQGDGRRPCRMCIKDAGRGT